MEGFYITVSNGLLRDEHRKKIGPAIWEFLWCIDAITEIDREGIGWVLGGSILTLDRIVKECNGTRRTVQRNLEILRKQGYIQVTRKMRGFIISVNKAKKQSGRVPKVAHQDMPYMAHHTPRTYQKWRIYKTGTVRDKDRESKVLTSKPNTSMWNHEPDDGSNLPVEDQDGNVIVSAKTAKPRVSDPSMLAVVTIWNDMKLPKGVSPRNQSAKDKLLPKCIKQTKDLQKAWSRIVKDGYTIDDFKSAVTAYCNEIVKRTVSTNGYHLHRFSLYDFLKNEKGFIKYANA